MTAVDYLATFRLQLPPFENEIDDRFFYAGSALMQRLDLLTHLTQFGEPIILVCGPAGSGKSTLLRRYISHATAQWRICAIHAHAFDRFASLLSDALNVEAGHDELELVEQWATRSDAAQLLVIVIDDAEQLDGTALQRLNNLLGHSHGDRIRVLLFGNDRLNQNVQDAQNRESLSRSSQLMEVPKLTEEETASYLMYRLAVAGYSGESPFTATQISGMCKAGDGRPGNINRLAHEALTERQARVKSQYKPARKSPKKNRTALWAVASVAALSLASYLGWQRMAPTRVIDPATTTAQISDEELPLSLPPAVNGQQQGITSAPVKQALQEDTNGETADIATILPAEENLPVPESESTQFNYKLDTTATLTAPPDSTQFVDDSADTAVALTVPLTQPEDIVESPEQVRAPAAEKIIPVPALDPTETQPRIQASSQTVAEPDTSIQAETGKPDQIPETVKNARGPHRETWLLQQNSSSFSLQLLGSRNETAISDFIRQNKLSADQSAYYHGSFKGKPWYVLLYGIYPSRNSALKALSDLPEAVRKGKPWPRDMKSIHKAIRQET